MEELIGQSVRVIERAEGSESKNLYTGTLREIRPYRGGRRGIEFEAVLIDDQGQPSAIIPLTERVTIGPRDCSCHGRGTCLTCVIERFERERRGNALRLTDPSLGDLTLLLLEGNLRALASRLDHEGYTVQAAVVVEMADTAGTYLIQQQVAP